MQLKESYEKEEIFCYAYKVQRKFSWFCDLLWDNYFISLIICNILVEVEIIGFNKKINEDLEKMKLYQKIIIIIIYLLVFLFIAVLVRFIIKDITKNLPQNIKRIFGQFIFYPLLLLSLFFFYLLNMFTRLSSKKNSGTIIKLSEILDNYCFIPISVSSVKSLNFFETELFFDVLAKRGIDILSNSFVLSSFFIIYDIIVFIITDIYDCNTKVLIWVQLGVSAAYFIVFIIVINIYIRKKY